MTQAGSRHVKKQHWPHRSTRSYGTSGKRTGFLRDSTIRWELANRGFNRKAIDSFSATFRATLEFANLLDDGNRDTPSGGSDASDPREPEPDAPAEEPESSPRTANRPMPSTDAATTKDWDLNIPLVRGGQAVLRIPIPLSETDFELVKAVVNANLDALKQSITRETAGKEDPGGD